MAVTRRRFVIVIAVIIGLGLMIGGFMNVTTQHALERAEAFEFRRMQVPRQGEDGPYRFFYVTNRLRDQDADDLIEQFGSDRSSELNFGLFDVRFEASLGIGMLVNPTDWLQNEEIQMQDVQALKHSKFFAELRKQVDASPERSLLVNINGFRERFPSALRKTAFLAHVLDIDSPLMVFDWPGDQGSTMRGYRQAQGIARDSGQELAQTIRSIFEEVRPDNLWLIANSMGGEVVVGAFTQLAQDPDLADAETEIAHVILTAPDVSHEEFGTQFRDEIASLTEKFTVYVSSNDRALLMSRILNRERRLGQSTVDPRNPDQSEEAAKVLELLDPDSGRVKLVDSTPINRTRNFHNFSLESKEFFDDLYLEITNTESPRSRLKYRVHTASGTEYWVLTRGR